jgi:NADH-quinone oxidoreductase subunit B
VEVIRQQLGAGGREEFRARQLRARDMLRGELEGPALVEHVQQSVLTTTLEKAGRWAVGNANFPLSFGLACCAIEWMSHIGPRIDIARFGFEAARATPRQADSIKMAPIIRRIYEQMLEPRYVIAMGACSSSMGVFNNYALVPGDKFLPVDIHVPGCPPRPESLVHGILKLRAAIVAQPDEGWRTRYGGHGTEEVVSDADVTAVNVPAYGGTDRGEAGDDGPRPKAQGRKQEA